MTHVFIPDEHFTKRTSDNINMAMSPFFARVTCANNGIINKSRQFHRFFSTAIKIQPFAASARVLVVGGGRMGQIRAGLLRANPRFELCGIVDNNFETSCKLAAIHRVRLVAT